MQNNTPEQKNVPLTIAEVINNFPEGIAERIKNLPDVIPEDVARKCRGAAWDSYMNSMTGKPCPKHGEENMVYSHIESGGNRIDSVYECSVPNCGYYTLRPPTTEQMQNFCNFMKT